MSDIEQRVKQAVAEQLGLKAEEIKNEASFMDDLGADSLDLVELVMSFENDFDITIPDEDSNEITTVQSAIDYVTKKTWLIRILLIKKEGHRKVAFFIR